MGRIINRFQSSAPIVSQNMTGKKIWLVNYTLQNAFPGTPEFAKSQLFWPPPPAPVAADTPSPFARWRLVFTSANPPSHHPPLPHSMLYRKLPSAWLEPVVLDGLCKALLQLCKLLQSWLFCERSNCCEKVERVYLKFQSVKLLFQPTQQPPAISNRSSTPKTKQQNRDCLYKLSAIKLNLVIRKNM